MRGAIIGFGVIASSGHAPGILETGEHAIVAVVDPVEARRRAATEQIQGVRVFASLDELLDADLELDFLDVASPPCHHLEAAAAAAPRGLHVLCEKPLATTLSEAREMQALARRHGVTIFPCHNYKHAPVVREMTAAIRRDDLGALRSATLTTFRPTHARGTPEWNADWRRIRAYAGGGIAMDHGSHALYLTFMFFAGARPRAVSATTHRLAPGPDERFDTEDTLCCVLRFDQGIAQLHLSWSAGVRKVLFALQGARGAMIIDEDEVQLCCRGQVERRTVVSEFGDASHARWFGPMFGEFVHAVEAGEHVTDELQQACWCMATIDAIYRSAAAGGAEVGVASPCG
jgi:predicted dehydrogenase